jgi:beta-lactam-binding protein with PASTA domain
MAGITESAGYEITISIPTEHHQVGRVLCPNLIGMTEAQAGTALTNAGLVKGVVTLTTGAVTKQNPLGGLWSLDGDPVNITLTS